MSDADPDTWPVCGEPVVYVTVEGPSPADRVAHPCGHRLPPEDGE